MLNSLLNNKIPVYKWWTNERIFQQNPSLCLHKDGLCYPLILFIVMLQVVKEFCHIDLFPAKFKILVPSDTTSTDKDKLLLTKVVLQVNVDI